MNTVLRKKKSGLCNPSTTVLKNMNFYQRGIFAVIGGPRIGFTFTLTQGQRLIVGSSPERDVQLDARGISQKHFSVYWSGDKIYIEDQQSSNGTFVNKRKITAATELKGGEQIKLEELLFLNVARIIERLLCDESGHPTIGA